MPRDPNRALVSLAYKADEREEAFYGTIMPQLSDFLSAKGAADLMPKICSVPLTVPGQMMTMS